jgi:hypothetical protein
MHRFSCLHVEVLVLLGCCRVLEQVLTAEECGFAPDDRAALLQLLSQAEKDNFKPDDQAIDLNKDRQSVLEKRLIAGPLKSSHLSVLQLLGRAEVCFVKCIVKTLPSLTKSSSFCAVILNHRHVLKIKVEI